MNKRISGAIFCAILTAMASLQASDKTLRADYIFSGGTRPTAISLHRLSVTDGWYGRPANLDSVPVEGNGEIRMTDDATGRTLYVNTFSTLFHEWLTTDESKTLVKGFENTFLLPLPDAKATISIKLYDTHRRVCCEFSHPVDPADELLAHKEPSSVPYRYIHKGGDSKGCIDVAIVGEGYTAKERKLFYKDAKSAVESILGTEPFTSHKDDFNFIAVAAESNDSGVSVPQEGKWLNTPVGSHFDTFYIKRYLTTSNVFDIHDLLQGLPYEHIVILANTEGYGGGGIYNSYTLTTAHHEMFAPVVVHEFGHSFGALADEYAYENEDYDDPYYFPDVEPWEQNITTRKDFPTKWKDMMDAGIPGVGLYEGGGYLLKGVWRPAEDCRMRSNKSEGFCPVCRRAIERMILFNTGK